MNLSENLHKKSHTVPHKPIYDSDCDDEVSNILNPSLNKNSTSCETNVFTLLNVVEKVRVMTEKMNWIKNMRLNPNAGVYNDDICDSKETTEEKSRVDTPHCILSPLSDGVKMKIHSINSLKNSKRSLSPSFPSVNKRLNRSSTPSLKYDDKPMKKRSRTPCPGKSVSFELEKTSNRIRSKTPMPYKRPRSPVQKESKVTNPLHVKFEKTYCLTCNEYFPTFIDFLGHLYRIHHKPGDWYVCMVCRYKGQPFSNLKSHYEHVHKKCTDLNNSCFFCCKYCDNRDQLLKHLENSHSNLYVSKTIRCNSCSLTTDDIDKFREHFFSVHDITCNICLKEYDSIKSLNRHIRSHYGNTD